MNHNDVIKKFELVKLLAALRLRHFQYPYERSSKVGGAVCGMLWVSVSVSADSDPMDSLNFQARRFGVC